MKKLLLLPYLLIAFALQAQTKLTIQSANEKCARVATDGRNNAFGDGGFWATTLSNGDGTITTIRSFLQFDLSSIPEGSFINWARLTLYTEEAVGGGTFLLRRVTSAWDEATVTWNTQPTEALRATIRLPISNAKGMLKNLNVTNLIQNMVDSPATSFGFALRLDSDATLQDESIFFISPAFHTPHYNPKLVLEYTVPGMQPAVTSTSVANGLSTVMTIYPNPCNKAFNCNIKSASTDNMNLRVIDLLGRTVCSQHISASNSQMRINLPSSSAGTYFVILQDNKGAAIVSQQLEVN